MGCSELLEEDPLAAFEFLEIFMMAKCLSDSEGTRQSVARAVLLLYGAAKFGR